jgi:hypothetical protein
VHSDGRSLILARGFALVYVPATSYRIERGSRLQNGANFHSERTGAPAG